MLNWLDQQGEIEKWTATVIRHIGEAFPLPLHENIGEWIDYLPHARQALQYQTTVDGVMTDLLFSRPRFRSSRSVSRSRNDASTGTGRTRADVRARPSRHPCQCQQPWQCASRSRTVQKRRSYVSAATGGERECWDLTTQTPSIASAGWLPSLDVKESMRGQRNCIDAS